MPQGTKTLTFFSMVCGNTMNVHQEVLRRLRLRLQLTQKTAMDNCDVVIGFVPIVSRAGTDIESALQQIPALGKPIVLMVLHFTFDEDYIAPESSLIVNRDDVFAVDLLCYEDLGLLRSLRNDEALKAVTDYLISKGGSHNTQSEAARAQRPCSPIVFVLFMFIFVIAILLAVTVSIYMRKWSNHYVPPTTTIMPPTTTINSTIDTTTNKTANRFL